MRLSILLSLIIIFALEITAFCQTSEMYWPKQLQAAGLVITLYEPEPEGFENNTVEARLAFSIWDKEHLPLFGAMWVRALVQTNTTANEVHFTDITVKNVNFPNASVEQYKRFIQLIENQAPAWHLNGDLKAFYAKLEPLRIIGSFTANLQHNPPEVVYASSPTVLFYIDGAPKLAPFSSTQLYKYVINSPYFIVLSMSDEQYYLNAGPWWYMASDVQGPWKIIETPPSAISKLAEQTYKLKEDEYKELEGVKPPRMLTVNEPAELIQTLGEPEIAQIYENLFTVTNSPDEIIFDSYKDDYYLLISGRWYKSRNLERGPWSFVEPSKLPEYFAGIPANSSFAHLRLHVSGTPEADAAVLDNSIPQTAMVSREKAKMDVIYDGEPLFEQIEGTNLKYAVNTVASVLQSGERMYYAVDQGIWFNSTSPMGPWVVAVDFPAEVMNIPPSCPVFNLKFVRIYDHSDEVVFVGYTPGYLGAFPYEGVVVYGTGYKYKSWYGDNYIPGPAAFGQGAAKKPAKTPNISFYASSGYGGPMMGPGYYGRPYGGYGMGYGYGYGYGMPSQYSYNQNYYAGQTVTIDHDPVEEKPIDLMNIYNNRKEGIIITETIQRNDPMKPVMLEHAPTDLYTGKDGRMYQLDRHGNWLEQTPDGWKATTENPRQ